VRDRESRELSVAVGFAVRSGSAPCLLELRTCQIQLSAGTRKLLFELGANALNLGGVVVDFALSRSGPFALLLERRMCLLKLIARLDERGLRLLDALLLFVRAWR
jgi:hypothetical protein